MNRILSILLFCLLFFLQSCKFSCSVGNTDDAKKLPANKEGVRIGNQVELQAGGIKVDKAYLVFDDGETVPDDNVVDFSRPVKLVLIIDKGWKGENDKVSLGASEKIEVESGEVLLDEKDLFENKYPDGMSASDAKRIALTASIKLNKAIKPLTTFIVSFRVWDKKGDGFVQGRYKLYSK
jgi:hypothetical protein